ncbi:Cytochrome b-c1 complex subunit 7, mitochondrial [Hanseniaspora osmophila]|uniref:Cytochrome b-c1 complex subunit 7 n=1 Tax=Hanseniaspora osmophila TaxID=56408 RepID=A0A1E5RHQ6_9ASCO|nr:Cytochrome b-c1 complex subunit 7 [Hanseniaspora osmophila]
MPQSFTSIVKMGDAILKSPSLSKIAIPVASAFGYLSGYRELGLRYNDLLSEENEIVQTALRRMPAEESYARIFRIIQAHQYELTHHLLPASKQTTAKDDVPYLIPYLLEAEAAAHEKEALNNLEIK